MHYNVSSQDNGTNVCVPPFPFLMVAILEWQIKQPVGARKHTLVSFSLLPLVRL